MPVRIVTDSTADLPSKLAEELGITVVPLNVHFGTESYEDRVTITEEEFYQRLLQGPIFPTSSQPSAGAFAETYQRLAPQSSGIVSIHVSSLLSGTINSALVGRDSAGVGCPIEIVDTSSVSMGEGLTVLAAARAAQSGASFEEVVEVARRTLARVQTRAVFDTLEYLRRGGRAGRAQVFLGTLLGVKPIVKIEGEVHPIERVRTRGKAHERLRDFVQSAGRLEEGAVLYSTDRDEAEAFGERIASLFPSGQLHLARLGPVVGTYAGPGLLGVAILTAETP